MPKYKVHASHELMIVQVCYSHLEIIYWHGLVKIMEKEMAPHSSTLAWRLPRTEEPGGLQSMGSLGVGRD